MLAGVGRQNRHHVRSLRIGETTSDEGDWCWSQSLYYAQGPGKALARQRTSDVEEVRIGADLLREIGGHWVLCGARVRVAYAVWDDVHLLRKSRPETDDVRTR